MSEPFETAESANTRSRRLPNPPEHNQVQCKVRNMSGMRLKLPKDPRQHSNESERSWHLTVWRDVLNFKPQSPD